MTDEPTEEGRRVIPLGQWRMTREEFHATERVRAFGDRKAEWCNGWVFVPKRVTWPHVQAANNTADVLREVFANQGFLIQRGAFITDDSELVPDLYIAPGWPTDYTDHPKVFLLMVEVADSTLDRDIGVKEQVYATAGVPEYWVLDVNSRRLIVHRDPGPHPPPMCCPTYWDRAELGEADTVSPLAAPAAVIRVADLLP